MTVWNDRGEKKRAGYTVSIPRATDQRLLGKPDCLHDFPGLSLPAVHRLADQAIGMFGVEAISPAPKGEPSLQAHRACADRDMRRDREPDPGRRGLGPALSACR